VRVLSDADALDRGDPGRTAAKAFAGEHADEDVKIELLSDIRHVFGALAGDQIAAEVLLQHLLALDDGRWTEFRGEHGNQAPKPLNRPAMVKMISAFGVKTKSLWPRGRRTARPRAAAATAGRRSKRYGLSSAMRATHQHSRTLSGICGGLSATQKATQAQHKSPLRAVLSENSKEV
jgi:hypothetical protein